MATKSENLSTRFPSRLLHRKKCIFWVKKEKRGQTSAESVSNRRLPTDFQFDHLYILLWSFGPKFREILEKENDRYFGESREKAVVQENQARFTLERAVDTVIFSCLQG